MKTLRLMLCIVVAAVNAPCQSGAPWPMYHRDLARTGQADSPGPRVPRIQWIASLGSGSIANYASPVIDSAGRVYIGTADGVLHVLNHDGSPAWAYPTGSTQSTFFGDQNTPSAAIAPDGTVYVLDPVGTLHKLTFGGEFQWSYDSPGTSADSHPVVLSNGDVLFTSYEYLPPVGANAFLVSIRPDKTPNFVKSNPGVGHVLSGPMVDSSGMVYAAAFDRLFQYDATGNPGWTYVNPTGHMYNTPSLSPDGHILVTDQSGYVVGVNPGTGADDWFYKFAVFSQSPVAVGSSGLAVAAGWPGVAAGVDTLDSGSLVWSYPTTVNGTPSRARSAASLDSEDRAYFGVDNGMIFALDKTGRLMWSLDIGTRTRSTPAFDAEGNLYIATDTPAGAKLLCVSSDFDPTATVGYARSLPNGSAVNLTAKPVTFVGSGYFYIQDWDGTAGVRVVSDAAVSVGDVVDSNGTMGTASLERAVLNATVAPVGTCVLPEAPHVANRAVCGGQIGDNPGRTGAFGLNNVGQLIRTSGAVSGIESSGDGVYEFWVNDGGDVPSTDGHKGVKVVAPAAPTAQFVTVLGVAGLEETTDAGLIPVLRLRTAADISNVLSAIPSAN